MGAEVPKQFLELSGRPVLVRTLERIREALPDARIVVSLPEGEISRWNAICADYGVEVAHAVVRGGRNRFASVRNALAECGECDLIAIHDGVRPLASCAMIRAAVETAGQNGSAVPVVAPNDSFRVVDGAKSRVVDRSLLRAVQTPQVFDAYKLRKAYEQADNEDFTDDASVFEAAGHRVSLCAGEESNIKITRALDMKLAKIFVDEQTL